MRKMIFFRENSAKQRFVISSNFPRDIFESARVSCTKIDKKIFSFWLRTQFSISHEMKPFALIFSFHSKRCRSSFRHQPMCSDAAIISANSSLHLRGGSSTILMLFESTIYLLQWIRTCLIPIVSVLDKLLNKSNVCTHNDDDEQQEWIRTEWSRKKTKE